MSGPAVLRRVVFVVLLAVALGLGWLLGHLGAKPAGDAPNASSAGSQPEPPAHPPAGTAATEVYAHNLLLHKGPSFRIYVPWIRGHMVPTRRGENPSFDDQDSFVFEIGKGVIRANIGDLSHFLNASVPKNSPLTGISLKPVGEKIELHGTVHKVFALPVSLIGSLAPLPDGRVRFHVDKIDVLKVPFKKLLGMFHIRLSDLVQSGGVPGIQISGNDILFDTEKLLPPPHIHGLITTVRVRVPDLEVIYGNAGDNEARLVQWHNFLLLRGGSLNFGKLTMHNADLTMIDASTDPWFDLDLVNYQAQLVNGYTRMTAQAGLEIFMPDLDEMAPKKAAQGITMEWLKDRNRSLPPGVPTH